MTALSMLTVSPQAAQIGYFSPSGVDEQFAYSVQLVTIDASASPESVSHSFALAAETGLKINLDLTTLISTSRPITSIETSYIDQSGAERLKAFVPRAENKLRDFLPDDHIREQLKIYLQAIERYESSLYSVFLIDEPYLNGVPRTELERVGRLVRNIFLDEGFREPKLGVLFASAMFNRDFAELIQAASLAYAERIDRHYNAEAQRIAALSGEQKKVEEANFAAWQEAIDSHRLTTYDSAGNLYTGGGIPDGFDIVAFDYYLSTFLFDELYENALIWMSTQTDTDDCAGFTDAKASTIRDSLSFFQDGPMAAGDHLRVSDDHLLDRLYACRVGGVLDLLDAQFELQGISPEVMVVTESSANGVLEFNSSRQAEKDQPEALIRKRVTDEVRRALAYLQGRVDHILFFTFADEYDVSIELPVGGVSRIPEAIDLIDAAADR